MVIDHEKFHSAEGRAFLDFLHRQPYYSVMAMPNDMVACVAPFLFTTAIITIPWLDRSGYKDRWCYHEREAAVIGLLEWAGNNFAGEPVGWHRHPATGRRRPNGDPAQEYLNR